MLLLANSFALGSLAGGILVALLSCYVVHDANTWFVLICAGYGVFGCLTSAIYAPTLKVLGFARKKVTTADAKRAFFIAAICALGQYLFSVVARTHEYDHILLFLVPLCAGLFEAMRVRKTVNAPAEPAIELTATE